MATFISRVISEGRLTIPKELREQEKIKEGDFVEVQILRKINLSNSKGAS